MNSIHMAHISATVPILKEHGVLLTKHFYNRMFEHHPELKNIFNMGNQKSGKQQTALAMAVLAYAEHISQPEKLLPVIDRIGHKHISLDIRPEHYQIVGNHLIASISEVLGSAATPEIIDAWTVAYNQLAKMMSGHETDLYFQQTVRENGWTGWRPFKILKREMESSEILSIYLYPADGGRVANHHAGQFISLRVFLDQMNLKQARQYSLSSAPNNEYYRISVKRELGESIDTNGMISNYLHDNTEIGSIVDLTAPAGNFILTNDREHPITLISGGVGATPLLSMLESLIESKHRAPITWLHGCRNAEVHAFKEQIYQLGKKHENFFNYTFYSDPNMSNQIPDGIKPGYLDITAIENLQLNSDGHYYICGPSPFIQKQFLSLINAGIPKENIYFEEFGPQVLDLN